VRLPYVNLVGVLVLGGFCVAQWRVNRELNLETHRLERLRLDQQAQIEERDRSLQGYRADLDQFRDQLTQTRRRLQETETSLAAARQNLELLGQERDQLRTSVTNWASAVAARDEQLATAAHQLRQLGEDRNEAVSRFNELAAQHQAVVEELNRRTQQ
jgi:septal ring factor EnvC (AmiA/AmiB activator)